MQAPLQAITAFMVTKTVKDMTMEKMFRQVGNEVVEYTPAEYSQYAKDQAEDAKQAEAEAVKAADKAKAKAKLEALGLTVNDLAALGL